MLVASEGSNSAVAEALLHNTLGVPLEMLVDWGDRQEVRACVLDRQEVTAKRCVRVFGVAVSRCSSTGATAKRCVRVSWTAKR